MTGGVSLTVRERPAVGAGHAMFPRFLGAMGASRGARAVRDGLAGKLAARLHASRQKGRAVLLPFAEALFESVARAPTSARARELARAIVLELELGPEEVDGLLGGGAPPALLRQLLPESDAPEEAEESHADDDAPSSPSSGREGRPATRAASQRQLADWGGG
jgi:hypothetical protein